MILSSRVDFRLLFKKKVRSPLWYSTRGIATLDIGDRSGSCEERENGGLAVRELVLRIYMTLAEEITGESSFGWTLSTQAVPLAERAH